VTATTLSGCAEERDPINRVQANALDKTFFVGPSISDTSDDPEFYTAATVIDVPYGADQGGAFPGLVGSLHIVKWEITENYLNARLTYESIEGVDGHGSKTSNNGQVIASYAIDSHFDIRHDYNASTGEELNIIVENTKDRPWYERDFFRVDWSVNYIGSSQLWDPLSANDYEVETLAYYVSDPSHPDAPFFDPEEAYFDVTNKLHLEPKMVDLGFGEVPACFYRGSLVVGASYPWGNCQNSEITVRYAYRRKAASGESGFTDYEPLDWDGSRMNAAGIFTRHRMGWDHNYGIVDEKWIRPAQRYNLWKRSHTDRTCATNESVAAGCDPQRDGDPGCTGQINAELANGTHDECEDGVSNWGSRCDPLVGLCTVPYAKRELKPIAWHYPVTIDDTVIYESTEFATWQWDAALRIAVQAARYAECVRTRTMSLLETPWWPNKIDSATLEDARNMCGAVFPIDQSYDDAELDKVRDINMCVKLGQTRDACRQSLAVGPTSVASMEPMAVLCHSPVLQSDHSACGKVGTVARPGDIRFHQVNVWPTRQSVSPWGYGPSLSDPLTGEIISAVINVYNAVTDSAAQGFLDQVRWINGEISSNDIVGAQHIHEWSQASKSAHAKTGPMMRPEDIQKRIAGMTGVKLEDLQNGAAHLKDIGVEKMADTFRALDRRALPAGAIPEDRSIFEHRIKKAKESGVEAKLMNGMWLQMAGVDPDVPPETKLDMASPLRGMSSRQLLLAYDKTQKQLAELGQCILSAPEPTGIPSLAKIMNKKFPLLEEGATPVQKANRIESMWNYLRFKMNYTVILHEMGHTIGHRHNFVSSYDKYAYKTQYWQLRTNSGKLTEANMCSGPQSDGTNCIGPRYYDPLTQDEIDNSIWTWQQTSVMDYAGDLTQDMLGLGIYDMAATRMFYADTVDVRTDVLTDDDPNVITLGDSVKNLVDYPGYLFGQIASTAEGTVPHYSAYNDRFKLVQPERCWPVDPVAPSWWDAYRAKVQADSGDSNLEFMGAWDPVFDGNVVHNERCSRPPVDYVEWMDMKPDKIVVDFDDPDYFTPRRAEDMHHRPRVPYGFLTDGSADGWSPSAFRHDNGADMYEEMVFHSNMYENRHIFDNFRRGRSNFTVYGAYQRSLSRYHAKVESLTQGFAFSVDYILREFAKTIGAPFSVVIAANAAEGTFLYDHAVAATVGFDHFVRVMTRPEVGQHYCQSTLLGCNPDGTRVLKPLEDEVGGLPAGHAIAGNIPNGNLIAGDSISFGGRPLSNGFQYAHGHWTIDYLNQAGSYYEKTFAMESMLSATYGAINFYRWDGLDARFRHVNFSDLFPEGMRRLIGVTLTEDYPLMSARIGSAQDGSPNMVEQLDKEGQPTGISYPAEPMAWLSFVPEDGPQACRPVDGILACTDTLGVPISNSAPDEADAWFVDPQLGYEVQKFIVFYYYVYQPGSEMLDWVDLLRVYKLGTDTNPDYLPASTVEWRDPESGLRYIAKRFGDETIFGKTYDKGIAAKMIQWANHLTSKAYALDEQQPYDPDTGMANVKFKDGYPVVAGTGICDDNRHCMQLRKYRGLLDFTRDTAADMGFPEPSLQIFGD